MVDACSRDPVWHHHLCGQHREGGYAQLPAQGKQLQGCPRHSFWLMFCLEFLRSSERAPQPRPEDAPAAVSLAPRHLTDLGMVAVVSQQ